MIFFRSQRQWLMSTDYNNNLFSTFIVLLRPEGFSVIIKYLIICPLNTPVMNIVAKFLVQGNNRSLCLSWNSHYESDALTTASCNLSKLVDTTLLLIMFSLHSLVTKSVRTVKFQVINSRRSDWMSMFLWITLRLNDNHTALSGYNTKKSVGYFAWRMGVKHGGKWKSQSRHLRKFDFRKMIDRFQCSTHWLGLFSWDYDSGIKPKDTNKFCTA